MNPLMPVLLTKIAAEKSMVERGEEKLRRMGKETKRVLIGLGSGRLSRKERRNIKRQAEATEPKGATEKRIEQLAGPAWTKGRYYRGAILGAGMGVGGQAISSLIQKRKVLDPRALLASGAIGAMYGAALPAARRLADIEAAKAGVY